MKLTCAVFCRVIKEDVILMNLFTIQCHNGPMNYNYYCHWIRMTCHATMLQILYVSVVYQLDKEWYPLSLGMTTFVVTLFGAHDVIKWLLQEPVVGWAGAYRWVRYSYGETPTVEHSCGSSTQKYT
jgi:hypothetical protein